ncbi:hypothetical protein ABT269_20800 [Streptomyces viridosporus]|uniref:hypothetical protein n=1 Tax=Streptomyces viridosporus TaxID=67581 RepID=UPI00331E7A9A
MLTGDDVRDVKLRSSVAPEGDRQAEVDPEILDQQALLRSSVAPEGDRQSDGSTRPARYG